MDRLLQRARELDAANPLAHFRDEFVVPNDGTLYMDGNSLGRPTKKGLSDLQVVVTTWEQDLVRGWGQWMGLPTRLGSKIGKLIGAEEGAVLVCDSTSVNLYKLALAALTARPERKGIISNESNFPSDIYILRGLAGDNLILLRDVTAEIVAEEAVQNTNLVTFSHTQFTTGQVLDMGAVNEAAHRHGAWTLWDLSHSVGSVPVDLAGTGADMAIGCTYKYLNGGPGAPAFLYVRPGLQDQLNNPIQGWLGHNDPFQMSLDYQPAQGLRRFTTGTPCILSMAPIEASVDLALAAGMDCIREVSLLMTDFLFECWAEFLAPVGIGVVTPTENRGSHVTFSHSHALAVDLALIKEKRVVPDFREPNLVRYGLSPLYTTFVEIFEAAKALHDVVALRTYESYIGERPYVT